MDRYSTRSSNDWTKAAVALSVCALLGWYAFVRDESVPMLWRVDLGFHELGHLLTYPFPDVVTAMMGSITQVLVPWGLAAYFLAVRADSFGCSLCLAWAATSAQNASVYVADAPYQSLQLIGGEHDWAFVLGPEHFDVLDKAESIGSLVRGLGLMLLACAVVIAIATPLLASRSRRRSPVLPVSPSTSP
jgi:hypothetical protein